LDKNLFRDRWQQHQALLH